MPFDVTFLIRLARLQSLALTVQGTSRIKTKPPRLRLITVEFSFLSINGNIKQNDLNLRSRGLIVVVDTVLCMFCSRR